MLPDHTVDPSTWHPSWCSSDHCTAPDRLAERGLVEADIPIFTRHVHVSRPAVVGNTEREEPVFTLQAVRFVDQPPPVDAVDTGVNAVEILVEWPVVGTRVIATLEADQLDRLSVAIIDLRALVRGYLGGDR